MKKIILLVVAILLLTGCNVKYEINITKDNIYEKVSLISENEVDNESITSYDIPILSFVDDIGSSDENVEIDGLEYYNLNKEYNGFNNLYLNYTFNWDNYLKSNIVNNSVSSFRIDKDDNQISIYTGSFIKAFEKSNGINNLEVVVNVSNDYDIITSNANSVVGNTLTWNITKDNYKNSPLNLTIKDKTINNNNNKPQINNNNHNNNENNNEIEVDNTRSIIIAVLSVILFLIVLGIIIVISKK